MLLSPRKITSVLDVGNSKIICIIAEVRDSKIYILGVGKSKSFGIKKGKILDNKLFESSVMAAISEAEKASKKTVGNVVVNISDPAIFSNVLTIKSKFSGAQVTSRDIKKIQNLVSSKVNRNKFEILKSFSFKHDLDDMRGVLDPEFMFVNTMTSYVHLVTAPLKCLLDLGAALLSCQVKLDGFMLSSEASALACLKEKDKQHGCILIDIGSDFTDYAIYEHGAMIGCGVLPFGGNAITKDIAKYFSLGFEEAETLKKHNVNLRDLQSNENDTIKLKSLDYQDKEVKTSILNKIAAARLCEIVGFVFHRIKEKPIYRNCLKNTFITGGAVKIKGAEEMLSEKIQSNFKVALPEFFDINVGEEYKDHCFSAAFGLLKSNLSDKKDVDPESMGVLRRVLCWVKYVTRSD